MTGAQGAPRRGAGPRVLVLTNMYPTPARPIHGIFVAEQVAALQRQGLEAGVLHVDGPADRLNYLRGVGQLRRALQSGRYDLIHAHYVFCGLIALTQHRLPVVVTHHGIEAQAGWTAPLCRFVSRRVSATIATSRRVAGALGLPGVIIQPCGVDAELFSPAPREAARRGLGLPADAPLVLFVGQPRPEKRFPLVEEAVRQLHDRVPAAQLVAVHDAPREQIPLYMNACDVLVLASTAEGSPMVVKEAMACNLPVVSVDVGDVAEIIGRTPGCAVVGDSPAALAGGLAAALAFGRRTDGRAVILSGLPGDPPIPLSLEGAARRLQALYEAVIP